MGTEMSEKAIRQIAEARKILDGAASKPPTAASALRSPALLDLYEGKYRDAERRLKECLIISRARRDWARPARTHVFHAILLDGQGDGSAAVSELDRAFAILEADKESTAMFWTRVGVRHVRSGAPAKAEAVLDRLRARVDMQSDQRSSFLHMLENEIALARGQGANELDTLPLADRESGTRETVAAVAHACDTTGDHERAIEYSGKPIRKTRSALGWEPQQAWIEAHARLAELQLSNAKAAETSDALKPLLQPWEHADPDLPLRKTITRLQQLRSRGAAFQDFRPLRRVPLPAGGLPKGKCHRPEHGGARNACRRPEGARPF